MPDNSQQDTKLPGQGISESNAAQGSNQGQGPQAQGGEKPAARKGARGTAAMDPATRQEVARKGGLAVSKNKQHMAEIGRKGGQTVSRNREHMAKIGRKGGAASRGGSKSGGESGEEGGGQQGGI